MGGLKPQGLKTPTAPNCFTPTQADLLLRLYTLHRALPDSEPTRSSSGAETLECRLVARYLAEVGVEKRYEAVTSALGKKSTEFWTKFEYVLGRCDAGERN